MPACFRYIARDVDAAIEFYTKQLGFKLEMHPAPPFAEISPGDMQIYLTQPGGMGGGSHMPSGEQQIIWTSLTISLDGKTTANTIMQKMLDQIYAVFPLQ